MEPIRNDKHEVRSGEHGGSQHGLVQQEFRRAKDYSSEYQEDETPIAHFFNTRLRRVSELLGDFKNGKALDVGCGPGIIGNTFRGRPIEYYGVDISEDMLKVCIDTFGDDPHFRFSLGRIEELQFSDSYFDVVLCLGAFEYVLEDRVAMSEIARVLKPNGTLIITMHNGTSPYRIWQRRFYWKLKNGISKLKRLAVETRNEGGGKGSEKASFKIHSKTSLQRLLSSCGLETEDIMYYDFNIFLKPLDSLFPRTSVFISKKLEFLCRSRLRFIGTGFILKSRKFR